MISGAAPAESRIAAARERARTAKQAVAIVASLAFAALVIVARHSHPGSTASVTGNDGSSVVTSDGDDTFDDDDGWSSSGWDSSIGPSQGAPQTSTRSS